MRLEPPVLALIVIIVFVAIVVFVMVIVFVAVPFVVFAIIILCCRKDCHTLYSAHLQSYKEDPQDKTNQERTEILSNSARYLQIRRNI